MAETLTITSQQPVVITAEGSINSAGEAVIDLTSAAPGAALLADENLGDVADAAAALANIGGASADLSTVAGASVALGSYANDAAAAVGGVGVGELYRNGSILMVRVA